MFRSHKMPSIDCTLTCLDIGLRDGHVIYSLRVLPQLLSRGLHETGGHQAVSNPSQTRHSKSRWKENAQGKKR
jgi:hypothetical protein